MNPVGKALWYIESHYSSELSLEDIARVSGVSRYYMTRAFNVATGHSLMRYVRGRRLTEAARSLTRGAQDILSLALDCGYSSHEAFTRAFREQFGVTPESVRAQRHLDNLLLVEPLKMDESLITNLEPPRFEVRDALLVAGLTERYDCDSSAAIPSQWQRFLPHFGRVPGQAGRRAYGVRSNSDDAGYFDYLCGVEVTDFSKLGADWSHLRIASQRYAVFTHRGHVSLIRRTWHTVWTFWLPQSGHQVLDAPEFELYGEDFDPGTGNGLIEIWLPLKA